MRTWRDDTQDENTLNKQTKTNKGESQLVLGLANLVPFYNLMVFLRYSQPSSFFFFFAALDFRCCAQAFSICGEQELLFVALRGLPIAVASLCGARDLGMQASVVAACRLCSCGSRALERRLSSVVLGLSCSAACGIFPDQGSNPCPLHWQADS